MRVYFEKPRTTVGWKGLINDPRLDDSFRINEGLRLARRILLEINELELPAGTEYLDMITPQYIADLIAGRDRRAHDREPGPSRARVRAVVPRRLQERHPRRRAHRRRRDQGGGAPHHFLSVTKGGHSAIVHTAGNEDCHIILRGGKAPNYDAASVEATCPELAAAGLAARLMIDCSHANSRKSTSGRSTSRRRRRTDRRRRRAHLRRDARKPSEPGRRISSPAAPLEYGVSITDACIGWETTVTTSSSLADAVRRRRVEMADSAASRRENPAATPWRPR